MKKTIILAAILFSISANAQKVTDTLIIKMDTSTYKYVMSLIQENIPSNSMTGKTILGNIITPLQKFTFLQPADKPKETIKPKQ